MMKRIAAIFVAVLLVAAVLGMTVNAERGLNGYVCDRAGIFSESEIADINSKISAKTESFDCDIYILTEASRSYDDGDDFVDEYGLWGNIIVLVIYDNLARNFDMCTYEKAHKDISDREYNMILDSDTVYSNIKSGNFYDGALGFIDEALKYYEDDTLNGSSTVSSGPRHGFWFFFWMGIIFGALTAVITAICIIVSYKRKLRSATYPLNRYARLDLKVRDDQFMGSFVTRRVIRTSSGGGSGGGGGRVGGRRGGR